MPFLKRRLPVSSPLTTKATFGPLVGAIAQSLLEGAGNSKGKGKGGATPLTHKPGCQAASTEKAVDDEWSSSDDDASDEECGSLLGE